MKRKIALAFAVLGILAVLFAFASCGEHEHNFGDWVSDGSKHWKTCLVEGCTEVGESASHKLKIKSSDRASCDEAGENFEVCEVCGYEKKTPIDPLGHNLEEKVVKKTCTKEGYTEISCTRTGCRYSEKKDIVPASHEFEEEVVPPTCTESGKTIYTCTALLCRYEEEGNIVDPLGHDEIKNVVAPTCTAKGYTTVTCSRCDLNETIDEKDIIPHSYEAQTVDPTCTEGGYTANVCTACGHADDITKPIAALGHALQQGTVVAPTCEDKGYTPLECLRCDYVEETELVDALGHDEQYGEPVAATCRKEGYTPITCSRCDYKAQKDIVDALGHTYYFEDDAQERVHYKVQLEPTCEDEGKLLYRCTRCNSYPVDGDKNIKPIPALGHDEKYEIVAPTCTLKGTTIVTCTRCEYEGTKDDVDPTGHTYYKDEDAVEGTHYEVTLAPTCTEKGEKSYYCQTEGCGALATGDENGKGEIAALDHSWIVSHEPWCGNDGFTEYTCERVCREEQCTATKAEEAEGEFKHTYDNDRVLINQTCVDFATYECPVCEKSFVAYEGDEFGQPTGEHKYDAFNNTVLPTCTEKGYTVYNCTAGNCGLTEKRDYTDLIAHTLSAVSEKGTVTCLVCNKSYIDVTAENVGDSDKICICGQDPCICDGTSADWEGFAKPKEPYAVNANEVFTITEVVWSEKTQPLAIGRGLIVLNSQEETDFTVLVYAEDGSEALYTFQITGKSVMIDLYQYVTVGKVEIISSTNATVSFYKSI